MSARLRKTLFFFLLLFFFFRAFAAFGGRISPGLASKLSGLRADESLTCLVVMEDQANIAQLNSKLDLQKATRQVRHQRLLVTLKDRAKRSQSRLVDYLNQRTIEGSIREFKSFWITNAILVTAGKHEIERIAAFHGVEAVYENYPITLVEPVSVQKSSGNNLEREKILSAIGTREAWAMGYTGKGRLVCSFDTGVDGDHPALLSNWRGNNNGSIAASWFDPLGSDLPVDGRGHGTHTMGVMTGITDSDTIGVAFDAQWICAAVIDRGVSINQTIANILAAFQWAVDPDGDPGTIDDVPDVINNSWGVPPGYFSPCDQTFWNAIDNVESAGVVVIFSAGNEGPDPSSIRIPADRTSSPTNSFSVGAIDALSFGYPVAHFSSRGPSGCDNQTIKPELCAPGVSIYSCYKDAEYRTMSGTSMAAPFVSAAVAILRQYNPDATAEQIKQALLESCADLGPEGEDNSYGHGLINIKRALEILPKPDLPNLYLTGFHIAGGVDPQPGDQVDLVVELKNSGLDAGGVCALLSTSDSLVQIASDSIYLGQVESEESRSNSDSPFPVVFDQNMPAGRKVEFVLRVVGDQPDYSCDVNFSLIVGSLPAFSTGEHDVGDFVFTLSNFGQYGLADRSFNPLGGKGWIYPGDGANHLYEAALLIGTGPDRISDGARGEDGKTPQQDFEALPDGDLSIETPGMLADQEGSCRFSDARAESPLGLEITQRSFAYDDPDNDGFLILLYNLKNTAVGPLQNAFVGLFFDWDISAGSPDDDEVGYDPVLSIYYQFDEESDIRLSVVPLSGLSHFLNPIDNTLTLYDGFSDQEKFEFLSGQVYQKIGQQLATGEESEASTSEQKDWSQMVSLGPISLAPQESAEVAFAIVGGQGLDEFRANVTAAQVKYGCLCTGTEDEEEESILPEQFSLGQNYPNPFNPATTIAFDLSPQYQSLSYSQQPGVDSEPQVPQKKQVLSIPTSLRIYNLRGQLVKTLIDDELSPGRYEFTWDGTDDKGRKVASGVYLYRLKTPQSQTTRRMILL